jgi:hypothetical protein
MVPMCVKPYGSVVHGLRLGGHRESRFNAFPQNVDVPLGSNATYQSYTPLCVVVLESTNRKLLVA